jgi:hypothetical protein
VLARFEARGISPAQVDLRGKDASDEQALYFADFTLKHLECALAHRPAVRGMARGDETTAYIAVVRGDCPSPQNQQTAVELGRDEALPKA